MDTDHDAEVERRLKSEDRYLRELAPLAVEQPETEDPVHFYDVVVEIPRGQRNKYEVDAATGRIWLDRTLFTATRYPADYGYIDGTLGEDGDPLDALVLLEEPTFPGCMVRCRPIAIFYMTDEEGPDAKVISVPARDPRYRHLRDLDDLPPFDRGAIQHFFMEYKALEPHKAVASPSWGDHDHAVAEVAASRRRAGGSAGTAG